MHCSRLGSLGHPLAIEQAGITELAIRLIAQQLRMAAGPQ